MTSPTELEPQSSWFEPDPTGNPTRAPGGDLAFGRLWHAFMTTRVMFALALFAMLTTVHALSSTVPVWLLAGCGAYAAATLAYRLRARPRTPGRSFSGQWAFVIGLDLVAFAGLHFLQAGGISYTPLFALPVLMSAVLGSRPLALATTGAVALLLMADAWWVGGRFPGANNLQWLQAVLTGSGLLVVAHLTNQLAGRLSREELAARQNRLEAHVQMQVNELVIQHLSDGVLIVDAHNAVRAANPAGRSLLGAELSVPGGPLSLRGQAHWTTLGDLAGLTFATGDPQAAQIGIELPGQALHSVQVRTQLTPPLPGGSPALCVMFLQDLRELEARIRTEKLAAMGRMSAAVAHEIRNPLAAIAQANDLLTEELPPPQQKQLTRMISQNVQRLSTIVDDVLDIARVQRQVELPAPSRVALDECVREVCRDWAQQHRIGERLLMSLEAPGLLVHFTTDHLRRVLVNLLDNAARHATNEAAAIQVDTRAVARGEATLAIWSAGPPIEHSVARHLFEPFFSSASRSTGLGLFICRELCERHGATITYERRGREHEARARGGNELRIILRSAPALRADTARP
jgi:two-component system, NtrC family, sensor histidine kinase PilS